MRLLFNYFIFPGFLFSACVGLFAGWVDRKVTARIQYRVGPPWYQNFVDIVKLLHKEIIIPEGARFTFLLAPFLGFLSVVLLATILGGSLSASASGFSGDLIVIVYLLIMPAIAMIVGASSSENPLASIGASREIKAVLAYELPFILSIIAIIVKSGGSIRIGSILDHQLFAGSNIASFSGALAFIVILLCVQAKLCFVPFDASEADQELMAGTLIEYSGLPLAMFKLTKAILLYVLPVFLIVLFMGKDISPVFLIGKYLLILVLIILIKNTNPRLRIDQMLRFFWGPVTLLSILALGLTLFGL